MPALHSSPPATGGPTPPPSGPPDLQSALARQSLGYDLARQAHDGTGWLVLAFTFWVLAMGWTAYFLPPMALVVVEMGGGSTPDEPGAEDSMMMDTAPEAAPETPDVAEVPPETPEVAEEIPEPVEVVDAPDVVTVPAPPEVIRPLQVAEVKPERPRPPVPSKPATAAPRSSKPPGPPSTATRPAAGTGTGSGAGSGTGAGTGPGKGKKNRTPVPRDMPGWAKAAGLSGTVIMTLQVDSEGRVTGGSISRSCGSSQLDFYTLDLVRRTWRLYQHLNSTTTQKWTWVLPRR